MVNLERTTALLLFLYSFVLPLSGCDFDYDNPAELCDAQVCMSKISGTAYYIEDEGQSPFDGTIKSCCMSQGQEFPCIQREASESGVFSFRPCGEDVEYAGFDFENGDYIHLTFHESSDPNDDSHINYVVGYTPTPSQIDDDSVFETGLHHIYKLNGYSTEYDPDTGAQVDDDLTGVSFNVDAGELGDLFITIEVLKYPLDEWIPPFLDELGLELDALFYLSPYYQEAVGGSDPHFVDINIEPSTIDGWDDPETSGIMYTLGDFQGGYLDCGFGDVGISDFVVCDENVTLVDGKITTRISRFGWMGLKKTN